MDDYRYGFNGKENDNEVKGEGNQQDYGFRVYDPRVGRFLSVDPITKQYPELTPYQYASNTPVAAIDIDGLEGGWSMDQVARESAEQGKVKIINAEHAAQQQMLPYWRAMSAQKPASISPTPKLETTIQRQEQKVLREAMFENAGYNRDGSLGPLQKLAKNETFQKLDENIVTPMVEMAVFEGAGRFVWKGANALFSAYKVANKVTNPVPLKLARVFPADVKGNALGAPGSLDVFVTAADDIAGLNCEANSPKTYNTGKFDWI